MTHTPPTSILTVQVWSGSRIEGTQEPILLHELHSSSTTIMLVKCSSQNLGVHIECILVCTCASN